MQKRIDASTLDLKERLVSINRVAKVVKGGRNFRFSALMVVGDENGHVGVGMGKAAEIPEAVRKGVEDAKRHMIEIPLVGTSIPHAVDADADHSLFPVDLAFTYGHSFFYAGFFPGLRQLFFIALIFQWIALFYLLEPGLKAFPVCHHADPVVGLHPEIITTLIADIFIFRCPVSVYHFLTFRAFDLCFCIYTSHTCTSYSASLLSLCPAHKKSLPQTILILTQR